MASERNEHKRTAAIRRAFELTTEALDLLDSYGGPAEAAVHLELCRQKLQEDVSGLSHG
jgi:hypothetical protein